MTLRCDEVFIGMKLCIGGLKEFGYSKKLMQDFFKLLQSELPLNDDVTIRFVRERDGKMTTGVRKPEEMKILAGGRMLIDVLRTLSHEWVHEYQHQKMGLSEKEPIQDIGGPEENMASVLGSIFVKKFQKDFPQHKEELYNNQ